MPYEPRRVDVPALDTTFPGQECTHPRDLELIGIESKPGGSVDLLLRCRDCYASFIQDNVRLVKQEKVS